MVPLRAPRCPRKKSEYASDLRMGTPGANLPYVAYVINASDFYGMSR